MTATDRIREILTDLERTRENLLALSDDIWLSIDHNDADALEAGVTFKRGYNEKLTAFDRLATELSSLVQQFTEVRIETEESAAEQPEAGEANQRIILALDREQPHLLSENFTYKRPYGFVLRGRAFEKLVTWKRLYLLVCQVLLEIDRAPLQWLAESGPPYFSTTPEALRSPMQIANGLHAEANLSANGIRDQMHRLLDEYGIPEAELRIYLREDRDAG